MEKIDPDKITEVIDLDNVDKVINLLKSYNDYSLSLTKHITYRDFWRWKKQGILNTDNIQDGVQPSAGVYREATRVNLREYFWIRIIATLKEFNLRTEKIKKIMELTHHKIDVEVLLNEFSEKELSESIEKNTRFPKKDFKNLKEFVTSGEFYESVIDNQVDYLFIMIYRVILYRHDIKLVIVDGGENAYFYDPVLSPFDLESIINKASLIIPLQSYLMDLMVDKENIEYLKSYEAINETEEKVLQVLRDEDVKYVRIKYKKGKPQKMMVDREAKINTDLALASHLLKGGYEDIIIKTQDGKVNYSSITENIKLDTKDT